MARPWSEASDQDMEREELLTFLTPEQIRFTDKALEKATADDPTHPGFGTQTNYIGGVLYWVIYWYGSDDERTRFEYRATDSFKRILFGDEMVGALTKEKS